MSSNGRDMLKAQIEMLVHQKKHHPSRKSEIRLRDMKIKHRAIYDECISEQS